MDCSFGQALKQAYEIAGTRGRIVVDRAFRPDDQPASIRLVRGDPLNPIGPEAELSEHIPPCNQYAAEADHFARSVRAGRVLPPAEDGLAQARAIEALHRSAENGGATAAL